MNKFVLVISIFAVLSCSSYVKKSYKEDYKYLIAAKQSVMAVLLDPEEFYLFKSFELGNRVISCYTNGVTYTDIYLDSNNNVYQVYDRLGLINFATHLGFNLTDSSDVKYYIEYYFMCIPQTDSIASWNVYDSIFEANKNDVLDHIDSIYAHIGGVKWTNYDVDSQSVFANIIIISTKKDVIREIKNNFSFRGRLDRIDSLIPMTMPFTVIGNGEDFDVSLYALRKEENSCTLCNLTMMLTSRGILKITKCETIIAVNDFLKNMKRKSRGKD